MPELKSLYDPAFPGCAVALRGRSPGTFGCLVQDAGEGSGVYLLSAAHVIGGDVDHPVGTAVLQPGVRGEPAAVIGTVWAWGEVEPTEKTCPNLFDAALAEVDPDRVVPVIHSIGRPRGARGDVRSGTRVQKCGATSVHTWSEVIDPDYPCSFSFYYAGRGWRRAGFQRQIRCARFTEGGDSGAAVLDEDRNVIGIVAGLYRGDTIVSPIAPILERFGVVIA